MNAVHSFAELDTSPRRVVTVGTFDGVHLGHRAILGRVVETARAGSAKSLVITFDPHPREVITGLPVQYLTSPAEKLRLIAESGIDEVAVINFTREFSTLSSKEFYADILLSRLSISEVIVGYDHMFGRDREADIQKLKALGDELGFHASAIAPVTVNGKAVGSRRIRELLGEGNVLEADECLGRPYGFRGYVGHGDGRGAAIGFPTANIEPEWSRQLIPAAGVYMVKVGIDDRPLFGMANIGTRPTFGPTTESRVEVHIFDLADNLYGKHISVHFLKRLRDEKKFASAEELVAQLHRDRDACYRFLADIYQ